MTNYFTIGQVAKRSGVSTKTIRFYESSGVIAPAARKDNEYRLFSERDVQRLLLVKRARDLGLPLEEVRNIVSACIEKGCKEAREHVASKVPGYIKQIDQQLQELQALRQQFEYIQDHYQDSQQVWSHTSNNCCEIIPIVEEKL